MMHAYFSERSFHFSSNCNDLVKEAPHLRKSRWWGAFLFHDIHAGARFELDHEAAGKKGDSLDERLDL